MNKTVFDLHELKQFPLPVNGIVTDANVKNILHEAIIVGVPEEWTA